MNPNARPDLEPDGAAGAPGDGGGRWKFLSRHAQVYLTIAHDPGLRVREVAGRLDLTERSVQRILRDLEQEGYIRRRRVGRQNRYTLDPALPLRHPLVAHREVRALLALLDGGVNGPSPLPPLPSPGPGLDGSTEDDGRTGRSPQGG